MNNPLSLQDIFSLSPLLILLAGSLIQLLGESFYSDFTKKLAYPTAIGTLLLALIAQYYVPTSQSPLLTPWITNDTFSRYFSFLFLFIGLGSICLTKPFFNRNDISSGEYYFFLLSSIMGLLLIAAAKDFLTLFIGVETLSIPLYILCGYVKKWKLSHEAALKYFLMGSMAAAFFIYGVALIYGAVGTTQFDQLLTHYQQIGTPSQKILFLTGISLVTLFLAFKAAIVPFHVWAPDVYDGAPTPVTAFMATAVKAGAFAAFARLFLLVLPGFDPLWNQALQVLAILTIIYANFVALRQVHLKRFFAYSGISHAGFLLFPLIAGTHDSLSAIIFYLVIYVLATLGCFAVISTLTEKGEHIKELTGLFNKSPFLGATLSLCLLTLSGIPPTPGFLAKLAVLKVAFDAGHIALVVVGLLTTILAATYYLRIVATIFSKTEEERFSLRPYLSPTLVGLVSIVLLLILTIYPSWSIG